MSGINVPMFEFTLWLVCLTAGMIALPRDRIRILMLTALFTAGFAIVSQAVWRRTGLWISRDGDTRAFFQLLASAVFIAPLACRETIRKVDGFYGLFTRQSGIYAGIFGISCLFGMLSRIPAINYSLNPMDIARAPWTFHAAMTFGGLTVLYVVFLQLKLAKEKNVLWFYGGLLLFPCIIIGAVSLNCIDTHYFHLHHYAWGLYLVFLFRFDHWSSRLGQAIALGIYVDGIASWGFHPWWYLLK